MTMRAGGHSTLIVAAALLCFAGPSLAADDADATANSTSETAAAPVRHSARHWKKYAHRKPGNDALKLAADRKAGIAATGDGNDNSSAISPSAANANAQMNSPGTPTGNAEAMTARANDILQAAPDKPADSQPTADSQQAPDSQPTADSQVTSTDRLDVGQVLRDNVPAAPTAPAAAIAAADTPEVPAAPIAESAGEQSTSDKTSLIGKIFIGFGTLLTMASAARMFMG